MAKYKYMAKDASGEAVTGVLEADSETAALRSLDELQLYPVRVDEDSAGKPAAASRGRIRGRDVGVMYGQLSDLLSAGVPLLGGLLLPGA